MTTPLVEAFSEFVARVERDALVADHTLFCKHVRAQGYVTRKCMYCQPCQKNLRAALREAKAAIEADA